MSGPVRTCVGCRQKQPAATLVRVARRPDGTLVIDRTAHGRGAWLCRDEQSETPRSACVVLADRRGGFSRAFRAHVVQGSATTLVDGRCTSLPGRGAEHARIDERAAHGAVPEKGLT
jgi:predicted RNA-binding protein YlxR (DUF448 family)